MVKSTSSIEFKAKVDDNVVVKLWYILPSYGAIAGNPILINLCWL